MAWANSGFPPSCQGCPIQDVDATSNIDGDLGHPTIPDVHGDDQGVVRKEDNVGVCVGEGDRPTRGQGWIQQDHSTGHVDVNGPLFHGGAFHRGGARYGVYFLKVDEGLIA